VNNVDLKRFPRFSEVEVEVADVHSGDVRARAVLRLRCRAHVAHSLGCYLVWCDAGMDAPSRIVGHKFLCSALVSLSAAGKALFGG
jgi:hypothetical protein